MTTSCPPSSGLVRAMPLPMAWKLPELARRFMVDLYLLWNTMGLLYHKPNTYFLEYGLLWNILEDGILMDCWDYGILGITGITGIIFKFIWFYFMGLLDYYAL